MQAWCGTRGQDWRGVHDLGDAAQQHCGRALGQRALKGSRGSCLNDLGLVHCQQMWGEVLQGMQNRQILEV